MRSLSTLLLILLCIGPPAGAAPPRCNPARLASCDNLPQPPCLPSELPKQCADRRKLLRQECQALWGCRAGEHCVLVGAAAGSCACDIPTRRCGELCVQLKSNKAHCGSCDHACPGKLECREGACVLEPHAVGVQLADVPLTGPPVTGSAALHEHVMGELAFSGKWFWGSVDGAETSALGLCDGDGKTHASAMGICSTLGYLGGGKDALGRDTCCHSGGLLDCNYKATNGKDPDRGDAGWDYLDWPLWDTKAHPRYWHGHLKKALGAGLKLIVAHAVENHLLCSLVNKGVRRNPMRGDGFACTQGDSFASVSRQIDGLKQFVARHSDFLQIALSPREARQIILAGRMAVVIGVEADYAWGNERQPLDRRQRLDDYHALGVRTIFLAHQVNTPLAGAALADPHLGVQQSFSNCFFRDLQCTGPGAGAASDPGHANEVRQSALCCLPSPQPLSTGVCHARDYGDMCEATLSRSADAETWDGFKVYPGGGVQEFHQRNVANRPVVTRHNKLGLTDEGRAVLDAMMRKGMLVEISHLSEAALSAVKQAALAAGNYPLIASHGFPRRTLLGSAASAKVDGAQYTHAGSEFALGDGALAAIRDSDGILGHFVAPDPAESYAPSKVDNNCARSTRSLAQHLAYAVDKGTKLAWAGDFMGFGQSVAPRRGYSNHAGDWCGGRESEQRAQGPRLSASLDLPRASDEERDRIYFGTRGFAHFGLLKALHDDLAAIGLPERVLSELRDRAAESFLRSWEKSEFVGNRMAR